MQEVRTILAPRPIRTRDPNTRRPSGSGASTPRWWIPSRTRFSPGRGREALPLGSRDEHVQRTDRAHARAGRGLHADPFGDPTDRSTPSTTPRLFAVGASTGGRAAGAVPCRECGFLRRVRTRSPRAPRSSSRSRARVR
jgi:hypothetical protein